jgi:hypothetical protein
MMEFKIPPEALSGGTYHVSATIKNGVLVAYYVNGGRMYEGDLPADEPGGER